MRNLKKILALVLALMMTLSLMVTASAATAGTGYSDDASITKYDEAVQVLDQLGVFRGNEKGEFAPDSTITRAEAAAIVYRIVSGDVNDTQTGIYADYNKFEDVPSTAWYAGYVNFVANGEYIQGDGQGHFYPMAKMNGYQLLAIILRAIGYGQQGEFQGTGWEIRTATQAKALGITNTITTGTLGSYITRAAVAEILFRGIALTETVDYRPLWGYTGNDVTLGYVMFGLKGQNVATPSLTSQTTRNVAAADAKYGEPVAIWYASTVLGGQIEVRFNPVATYTVGVADEALFAATGATGTSVSANVVVNGGSDSSETLYKAATGSGYVAGGKGTVTELFVADGRVFVVVKETFVDTVATKAVVTAAGVVTTPMALTSGTGIDADTNAKKLTLASYKAGDVVIFNKYGVVADYATIHAPAVADVTVTKTYDTSVAATSYFVAGKTYEYNCNLGSYLADDVLNRDDAGFKARQYVFTDDYGYVVYTADWTPAANATGYMVVTSGTLGGRVADNQFVLNFTGYGSNGAALTVRGGLNTAYYTTADLANTAKNYVVPGIYKYEIDAATGMYKLTKDGVSANTNAIDAGDAEDLAGDVVLNDTTVFVIAKYDAAGIVNGYDIVTGFKNIKDLDNGNIALSAGGTVTYGVQYTAAVDTVSTTVDFVYVEGAKQTAQLSNSAWATADDGIYLLDNVSLSTVSTHDTHKVVKNGGVTTIDVVVDALEGKSETFWTLDGMVGSYYATGTTTESTVNLRYYAPGVLRNASAGTWVTLANNCAVYNINTTAGTCTALSAAELASLNAGSGYNGFIAATDAYGYATVVYFVNAL